MGQSFGHFGAATNRDILPKLASGVRKGGRVILDFWNPERLNRRFSRAETVLYRSSSRTDANRSETHQFYAAISHRCFDSSSRERHY